MALVSGTRLAEYEVLDLIGVGGMGEVYRARDTKLERDVAIKVLPEAFAEDRDRLARFEREARILASLNHPNIAAIYGLEESDGVHFLAMELVPGETLAERLSRGPLSEEEAVPIFKQIADALEAAHENGIVHRDLKPANIKITPDGVVKVLDFGLAKALQDERPAASVSSEAPTLTREGTRAGVIMGTAYYMSPEQARGKTVDKRADIWAFGCVVYEALTGEKPFRGETTTDVIAAVVKNAPDWSVLPPSTPSGLRRLLLRCLQKDPNRRLRDIADARLEIEEASVEPAVTAGVSGKRMAPWSIISFVAGLLVAGIAIWLLSPPRAPSSVARFSMGLPESAPLALDERPPLAISPDGSHVVYVGESGGTTDLYVRAMDDLEARPVPDTEGASGPFFSPDGQWVGFWVGGALRKLSLTGGGAQTISRNVSVVGRGYSWGVDDAFFINRNNTTGLVRLSGADGTYEEATTPDPDRNEINHCWPQILPAGDLVLVTIQGPGSGSYDDANVAAIDLETSERRILITGGYHGRYVPTGHLVYVRAGTLMAVPFELSRLEVTGPPVSVLEGVMTNIRTGAAYFTFSETGSLVYVTGGPRTGAARTLVWVDRSGIAEPLTEDRRAYVSPRLSPDGRRLAVTVEAQDDDVWIYELDRGTFTRLTFGGRNVSPAWTPDGKRVAFTTGDWRGDIHWKLADGSGGEEQLIAGRLPQFPNSWSSDGKILALTVNPPEPGTGMGISMLAVAGERELRPFLDTPRFSESQPRFSPDGRWLAYTSNESGRDEVYVVPFPGPGRRLPISTDGGTEPVWARNGRELFYRNGDQMMAVAIDAEPEIIASEPVVVFEGRYFRSLSFTNYDISPDGRHFIMIQAEEEPAPRQLNIVLNWFDELKGLVPTGEE